MDMKKILAIFAVLCLSFTGITGYADDGLIFEMDLSAYSDSNPVVLNGVTESAEGITVYGRGDYSAPVYDSLMSIGGETRYLTFGHTEGNTGTPYGVVQLDSSLANPMAVSDKLTVEFWTLSDTPSSRYLYYKFFKLAREKYENATIDGSIDWETSIQTASKFENRLDANTVRTSVNNFPRGQWTHYVFTREWDAVSGEWDVDIYINGVSKGSYSGGTKSQSTENSFTIGGSGAAAKSYQGSIAEFRIYDTAFDADKAKAQYLATKDNYVVLPETMNIVTPSDDFAISASAGHIEIEFDNYIDKSTLSEITFTTVDGDDIPGGIFIETEEGNTKRANLYFGRLEPASEYILHIGEVKSINNITVTPEDFIVSTNDIYIVNQDFSDYPTGTMTEVPEGPLTFFSSGVNNSVADFAVKEQTIKATGETIKYLEMKTRNPEGAKDSYLAYNFPPGYTKDFVVEVGVRGAGGSALDRSVRLLGAGSAHMIVGGFNDGGRIYSNGNGVEIIKGYSSSVTDKFGFLNMVYTFRMNENGTYTVTGMSPDNSDLTFEAVTKFTDASQIRAINQYNETSDALTTEISHFRIYEYISPEVVVTNLSSFTRETEFIEITFSDDMTGFNDESIVIVKEDGELLNTAFEDYDEDTRTARVRIKEYFDYGKTYTLNISNIKSTAGIMIDKVETEFDFPAYELYSSVSKSGRNIPVILANNSYDPKTAIITAVSYDENGKIAEVSSMTIDVSAINSKTETLTAAENAKEVYVYVFDVTEGENRAVTAEPYVFTN